jgi:serine/threonine protein phosphatase PrpC
MDLDASIVCLNLRPPKALAAGSTVELPIDIGTRTDAGRVRLNNEDSLLVAPEMSLFVLSDGMGGLACGEVASRLTVETLLAHCREADADPTLALIGQRGEGMNETSNRLASGIQLANRIVYRAAQENGSHQGMGATVVAVRCANERLNIAHVGDSRAYRLRNGCLERLTQDHSFAAEQIRLGQINEDEAKKCGLQNILTRAVGVEPELEVDISEEIMMDGDTILLCSDGLTHEVSDKQIASILRDATNAQEAATRLVDLANQAGGGDNITTIVIRQGARMPGALSRTGLLSRWFNMLGT